MVSQFSYITTVTYGYVITSCKFNAQNLEKEDKADIGRSVFNSSLTIMGEKFQHRQVFSTVCMAEKKLSDVKVLVSNGLTL
jgi:hypothetical protein